MRQFKSGATRNDADEALEPWGFTSPLVEKAYCEYMHRHRKLTDGTLRDSDDWKRGMPLDVYFHSLSRHALDFRLLWERYPEEARTVDVLDALLGVKFNVDGLIYELKRQEILGLRGKE